LEKDGKHEEAERVRHEIQEMYSRLAPRGRDGGPAGAGPDREKVREQMQAMRQKIEQLEKEGKHEEAEKVKREAYSLMGRQYPRGGEGGSGQPQAPGDISVRIQHLRAAAENLKAAGMDQEAQRILQVVDRIEQRGEGEGRSRSAGQPTPGRGPRGDGGTAPEVQELRSQIQQMHHEMEEMREQIKRMADRPSR
jgi:hypothetical protein